MVNTLNELGKQWDKEIQPVLREQSVGRKLIPLNKKVSNRGIGQTSIATMNYTATAGAVINYNIQNNIEETTDITSEVLKIPVQQDDRTIGRRAYESYKLNGTPIDTDMAFDMAANVTIAEDALIIDGWKPDGSNYEIDGMYNVAGNTFGGASFGTNGNARKAVAAAIGLLKADKIYSTAWNLTLNHVQHSELMASTADGIDEYDQVIRLLNRGGAGGQIFESGNITAGTGMVSPIASPANIRYLVEAQRPTHELWFEEPKKTGPVKARLLGAVVPRFKHLDGSGNDPCICTLTGI
ncbi:MAG: hypothetical protein GWP10_16610 [Nitrospiraceae bacterium]|nr:hypothetical protein [Nitrospiraceae bacterium]